MGLLPSLVCAHLALTVCPAGADVDPDAGDFDWGPLASRYTDANGDERTRVLGPVFESATSPANDRLLAVRPFFSRHGDAEAEITQGEFLWPLCLTKSFREQASLRILTLYALDWDRSDPTARYRFWIVPFYFQGRTADGKDYRALFPLYGRVREFMGQDTISFVLFPIRMKSTLNELDTRHVFWPIYSRTKGSGIYRFRMFPFYAQSRLRDNYVKKAVLWPFWTSAEYFYPTSHGSGYILFPLWGRISLNTEQSWIVLPPFFRVTKGSERTSMYLPYPFVQYSSGDVEKLYLFPLWGAKTQHGSDSGFFLWPVFSWQRIDKGDEVFKRFLALPFWLSHTYQARTEPEGVPGEVTRRYTKVWPLLSYQRDGEQSRWRALELWPLQFTGPIERNFAPFWTLYQRTANGPRSDTEALWGLYRYHRDGDAARYWSVFPFCEYRRTGRESPNRSFSIGKGLLGYHEEAGDRRWTLLYLLHLGGRKEAP